MADENIEVTKTKIEGQFLTDEERKALFKEAMKEWMNEERHHVEATVGRWLIRTVAGFAVMALMYVILWSHGWVSPM